ncbi:lipopolysaccharide-induced tumor necrosis factor-alpha factor homolog [Antedon mediterranea]|uniref:lipopolysaccharide-induced tumor necrosis factor-alpha factor homolog n=1 Tax=Antedon mediterranea TaxID=105859 RepID=UPI003AF80291
MSEPHPPPYSQAVGQPGMESKGDPAYPPSNPGYPPQGPPPAGYQATPPPAGYAQPPPAGYAQPPPAGYPQQAPAGYPQQAPGGYPQPYQQPQTTVVVGQPSTTVTTVVHQVFREFPVQTTCPNCRNNVTTVVRKEPGMFAWLLCLIIAFFGGWMGCCLIPFCIDGCHDCTHTCPVCQYQISHYNRM